MAEDFRPDFPSPTPPPSPDPSPSRPDREPIRLIVVSSRQGVTSMIHTLHLKTVADANEWSPLQPEPMTGKWMSVVTKYIQVD